MTDILRACAICGQPGDLVYNYSMRDMVHPDCLARLDGVVNHTRPRRRGRRKEGGSMMAKELKPEGRRTRGKLHITPEFMTYMDNRLKTLERNPDAWVMANSRNIARDLGMEPYAASLGVTVYADLALLHYNVEVTGSGTAFSARTDEEKKALESAPPSFRNVHPDDMATIDSYVNAMRMSDPSGPVLINAPILSRRGYQLKTRPQCHWMIFQAYFARHPEHNVAWGGIMTIYKRNDTPGDYISYIIGEYTLLGIEGVNLARKLCSEAQHE